ncbi:helix-turn-helix domain-containing protein [Pseudolactococcus carnosus]|uniref:Helix-turn-helix domain-containing protein n=1 Tax=Pseudolactococcus carnosus TaxID=2749961 RepID=A0ABT0AV18_9LACT|nr:helix-turn-helix domain-containing protein [Lactococcus carnosus]MCJ1990521.1 helix-turn-helix domain-containing protein [Lactococcus carnosus]MCJ2001980.1 helix-turn-helix domain-containing protein [Lactococcus carnosus]
MDLYEKIKGLASSQKISIRQLEEKLDIANGTIRRWSKSNPSTSAVTKVADYFHVSVDYLLGREALSTTREPIDLADLVDESKINWDEWVSFDGKPLTDEVKTAMKLILGKRLEN